MIDDQSGAMGEGWPLEKKYYQNWTTLKKFSHRRRGANFTHVLSADVSGEPSDTNVGEKEVTQSSELGENEKAPQHLRQL